MSDKTGSGLPETRRNVPTVSESRAASGNSNVPSIDEKTSLQGRNLLSTAGSRERMVNSATGSLVAAREKVRLAPGHSAMDWYRLCSSGTDLRGVQGIPIRVTKEELQKHNTCQDCWMVLYGKVFNITQYMNFHPGGVDKLMLAAGKDGTQLFQKYHTWVNYESLLKDCFLGFYVG